MIEIHRVQGVLQRRGEPFLARIYTLRERTASRGRVESLAARFAAKEAVAKALGTGIGRQGIRWTDIEIVTDDPSGAPILALHGPAAAWAAALGLREWSVSLTHDGERALAFAVML